MTELCCWENSVWLNFFGEAILLFFNSVAVDRCSTCSVASTNSLQERRSVDGTERGGVRRRLGLAPSGVAAPALSEQKMLNIAEFSGNPRYSMGRIKG